jgi:hypothetical protein
LETVWSMRRFDHCDSTISEARRQRRDFSIFIRRILVLWICVLRRKGDSQRVEWLASKQSMSFSVFHFRNFERYPKPLKSFVLSWNLCWMFNSSRSRCLRNSNRKTPGVGWSGHMYWPHEVHLIVFDSPRSLSSFLNHVSHNVHASSGCLACRVHFPVDSKRASSRDPLS